MTGPAAPSVLREDPLRLAVISDLHATLARLQQALARIDALECTHVVCAGDVVDDGAEPVETLELLRARAIPCIRGNHERWALQRGGHEFRGLTSPLPGPLVEWISGWPTSLRLEADGVVVSIVHGSPVRDMEELRTSTPGDVLEAHLRREGADLLVCGHTHDAFVRQLPSDRLVVNAGTLGAPWPGQVSTFAWIDVAARRATIERLG